MVIDGGAGKDLVVTIGGTRATTAGGVGKDWIYNRSNGSEIYGDTVDRLDTATGKPVEDNAANSDNIWYSPNTVVKDAQHHDFLKFYGLTLTGGNAEGGIAGLALNGALGGAMGLANFYASLDENGKYDPARSIYFDHLLPWMTYMFRPNARGNLDMYVTNSFDQVFNAVFGGSPSEAYKKQQELDKQGILKGWMKVENFDLVGSYLGGLQTGLDRQGTFNMVFKAPNPIADLLALMAPLLGAIGYGLAAKYGGLALVEQALTLSAAVARSAKGTAWAAEIDPLVIDLDGDGLETTELATSGVYFDLDQDLFAERTGWISADDGFLVRDRNNNGRIDDISEMFGGVARSGFADLAELDADGDGRITKADLLWSTLQVWRDRDGDGETDSGELLSLDALGIKEISLATQTIDVTTPQGTRLTAAGQVSFADGRTRRIFDAVLPANDTDTRYAGEAGRAAWQGERPGRSPISITHEAGPEALAHRIAEGDADLLGHDDRRDPVPIEMREAGLDHRYGVARDGFRRESVRLDLSQEPIDLVLHAQRLRRQLGRGQEDLARGAASLVGRGWHAGYVLRHIPRAMRRLARVAADLARGRRLLSHRRGDRRTDLVHARDRGAGMPDRFRGSAGGGLDRRDLAARLVGGAARLVRQRLHLGGDDREAAARLARPRHLDGGVERSEVRLAGDRRDGGDGGPALLGGSAPAGHRRPGRLSLMQRVGHNLVGAQHLPLDLLQRRDHPLGRCRLGMDVHRRLLSHVRTSSPGHRITAQP
jgi:hypothetical protein